MYILWISCFIRRVISEVLVESCEFAPFILYLKTIKCFDENYKLYTRYLKLQMIKILQWQTTRKNAKNMLIFTYLQQIISSATFVFVQK